MTAVLHDRQLINSFVTICSTYEEHTESNQTWSMAKRVTVGLHVVMATTWLLSALLQRLMQPLYSQQQHLQWHS